MLSKIFARFRKPKIDPTTGRPYGDHGTALDAINWLLKQGYEEDAQVFLRCWYEGNLAEWPEYYAWLTGEDADR